MEEMGKVLMFYRAGEFVAIGFPLLSPARN